MSDQPHSPALPGIRLCVIGGTYREITLEPIRDALRGSGLRAAALLASLGDDVTLETYVDDSVNKQAEALMHDFRLSPSIHPRTTGVTFRYQTPSSSAEWINPDGEPVLNVQGFESVLAFGMVESSWSIVADRVVIDPQHGDLASMLAAVEASRVAIVLNGQEARRLTGLDLLNAGHRLLSEGAEVVVVKQGALGGQVFHHSGVDAYGPIPTKMVNSIGSGDAFSAGFAHMWLCNPDEPLLAAQFGAQVAAAHSLTDVPQVSADLLATLGEPLAYPERIEPKVYLAAPFFTAAERLLLDVVKRGLEESGVLVFSPLHEIGAGGDEVAKQDLAGLRGCHAVLALLDGGDPGTVFETGWATRAEMPIVGFSARPDSHDWTMLRGTGTRLTSDLTDAIHFAAWAAVAQVSESIGKDPR